MAASEGTGFACTCGSLRGRISPATPRSGTHMECYCRDCRAALRYFGQPDPATGGVALYLTTPDTITIETGQEHLGLMRLGPRGPLRWHATCCKAPLFNTLANPRLAFAAVHVLRLSDPDMIGPVLARNSVPRPGGAPKNQGASRMVWRLFTGMGAARLSGRWRDTPFFDLDKNEPVVEAVVLDKQERAALYPDARNTSG